MMPLTPTSWLTAHRDLVDVVLSGPDYDRLSHIRCRLKQRGYALTLDIGKRRIKAKVAGPAIRSRATYPNLASFIADEEARLVKLEEG